MALHSHNTPARLNRAIAAALATVALAIANPAFTSPNDDANAVQAAQDTSTALVQLNGDPLATYTRTKPAQGKKIDFNSSTVKSYRAQLSALRNDYKAWLHANVPQAKITGEFDISLNAVAVQLNGATLAQVAAGPQVKYAQYEVLYHPSGVVPVVPGVDPDLALISAKAAWPGGKGDGVKVAIIDTGIDISHPCFSDAGYAAQQQLGDHTLTNNKVIAAKVFNNRTPTQHYTAQPLQEHGTHVAGTVACDENTAASVDGVAIPYGISGVAPRALLGNYNVFPADVLDARSEDILKALETAYADGFDVANMSLGGGYRGVQDLVMAAVDNLDQANMVVAVAAGNSGPGHFTVESPGAAARALTAGASTVPHFIGATVTVNSTNYASLPGDFATVAADLTAPLGVVLNGTALGNGCAALAAGSLSGKIALIARGTCSFSTKIRNAQAAGALATLIANNLVGDPIAMGQDGTPNQPTIPAYMVSRVDGATIKASDGLPTTISATLSYFQTTNADIMASFSSQGPTLVDFRVKPDVVAPGVNVLSSIPAAFCSAPPCFAFFQGTSMATPHLAGSAAVVRQQHPDWSASQIRSAIVNMSDAGVLKNFVTGAVETDLNVTGAGRDNLLSAAGAKLSLDPVSVSFGAVPSPSGQTRTFDLTVTNLTSGNVSGSISISTADRPGIVYSVSPSSFSLPAGGSTTVTVAMAAGKDIATGGYQATLTVGNAHAAVYTTIK